MAHCTAKGAGVGARSRRVTGKCRRALACSVGVAAAAAAGLAFAQLGRVPGARHELTVGGVRRSYWLVAPSGGGAPKPVVLLFHGGLGSGRRVARYTRFAELATREGFVLACPDGIGGHWNDGRGAVVGGKPPSTDDVAFASALIDELVRTRGADPKRVCAAGISNGAMLVYRLGGELAPKLAAIATVSGAIPERIAARYRPAAPVPLIAFNGTADPLVPFAGGTVAFRGGRVLSADESVLRWVRKDGCPDAPVETYLPHRYAADPTRVKRRTWRPGPGGAGVVQYRIEGGGHPWPDGRPIRRGTGLVTGDVDATVAIWQFFRGRHRP